ncbi:UNVERIFIED_CONTAM: hypothetical protein FKN15_016789 [Acipenser sinensis]
MFSFLSSTRAKRRRIRSHPKANDRSLKLLRKGRRANKDYRLQTTDYRLQTTDYRLQTTDYRLQTTDYRLQTTDYRLQTTDYRLQTTDYRGGIVKEWKKPYSQEEINKSLDLAREAFPEEEIPEGSNAEQQFSYFYNSPFLNLTEKPSLPETKPDPQVGSKSSQYNRLHSPQTNDITSDDHDATKNPNTQNNPQTSPQQLEAAARQIEAQCFQTDTCCRSTLPENKEDKPKLVNQEVFQSESASRNEFCNRASSFIEELSSIFRTASKQDRNLNNNSSSPDSGYLSPKNQVLQASTSAEQINKQTSVDEGLSSSGSEAKAENSWPSCAPPSSDKIMGSFAPPRFTQKLKSQEVAEGRRVQLMCRANGNPEPVVR